MTSHTISAENLGPITSLEFALQDTGVTVLVAPNGSGKSILLDAVQTAAIGSGKLPLRDRTKKGKFEAFGACITIGGTCRHTGGFSVTNLEGRFDLAELVDPRLQSPAAADRKRIKALVSLTGVSADANLFKRHEAFDDFETVVLPDSLKTDDLIEMASRIKDNYDTAALNKERLAERESGMAVALIPPSDLDLLEESDATVLQAAYNAARDEVTRLNEQARQANAGRERARKAKESLQAMGDNELLTERDSLSIEIQHSDNQVELNNKDIADLTAQIERLKSDNRERMATGVVKQARISSIERQLVLVEEAKKILVEAVVEHPDQDDIDDCQVALALAAQAIETGTLIRAAKADVAKMQGHRAAAKLAKEKADKYRDAGKATDEVLSNSIKCAQLRVESDGKSARLVSDTERGKSIQYHDLSDGERWRIAIDIGADQVGEGGLLVISQIGWEGIDGKNRHGIHNHAKQRGVYILTAEAANDPDAKKELKPLGLEAAETEQIAGLQKAQTDSAKQITPMAILPSRKETVPEPPVKPEPVKPAPKPKAAEKKAPPAPTELFSSDDDDIPF